MPDINNNLILVKGQDKTTDISSWRYQKGRPIVWITFNSNKEYPYNTLDVEFLKNPKIIEISNQIVLNGEAQLTNVNRVQYFGRYCRIIFKPGYNKLEYSKNIKIIDSALNNPKSMNCFEYLKQIAHNIGLETTEGYNILAGRYEKINFIRDDSVLATYLSGKLENNQNNVQSRTFIYPFGFNLSQKKAVDNALNYSLSIIEGPPGTGKTQTILNIIANAVMRGESVAVVSSNNSATANVLEKLEKYGVSFIAAPLGNSTNKESFILNQSPVPSHIQTWKVSKDSCLQNENKLRSAIMELDQKLLLKNQLSTISAEKVSIEKEFEHFSDYYETLDIDTDMPYFSDTAQANEILSFIAEYELMNSKNIKIGFFTKLKWRLSYKIRRFRFINKPIEMVTAYCQNEYYTRRIKEINERISQIKLELDFYNFDGKMKEFSELSMTVFKSKLADKYGPATARQIYSADDLWKNSENFIRDYPVVLSTTYSLRASLSNEFAYDYVIVDEASQVDLATGALALSCANKAVIVGDLKQLPNVVTEENKTLTNKLFEGHSLHEAYRYGNHSLLSSITELFPNVPSVLLKEHYRCHPEIIGFCNQRFYNNELIILTKPKAERQPLLVYRTAAGNHARKHVNERQIDVITDEVLPQQNINPVKNNVGIVTPYRAQADRLQDVFRGTNLKADTVDKFQGQERDIIILSTVDNEIGDFVSNPNRLNVAVSRAVEQFIVVTDGNDNDKESNIHELIGYIQYNNHDVIDSNVFSVFDYLYKHYEEQREKILQKHGKISEYNSENLLYQIIRDILAEDQFNKYGVVSHVPLRMVIKDLQKLDTRELMFATNHLTHVDFLVYSKLTHQPILVIEVDGYAYHQNNQKQTVRDNIKDSILKKYDVPILRLSTIGSNEKGKIRDALEYK